MLYTKFKGFLPVAFMGQEEVVGMGLLGSLTPCWRRLCEPPKTMAPAATCGLNPALVPSLPPLLSSPARETRAPFSPKFPKAIH